MTERTLRTVIPALPGYDVVELRHQPYELSYVPIIAWVVTVPDADADDEWPSAAPVCIDWNSNDPAANGGIRQPNGDIVFVDSVTFAKSKEAEALAYMVKRYEKQRAIAQVTREAKSGMGAAQRNMDPLRTEMQAVEEGSRSPRDYDGGGPP